MIHKILYGGITFGRAIAMRNLLIILGCIGIGLLIPICISTSNVGCIRPTVPPTGFIQVASATQPAVEANFQKGMVQVVTSMPAINVNKDAIPLTLNIQMPVQNEFNLPKIGWVALVLVALLIKPPWDWSIWKKKDKS